MKMHGAQYSETKQTKVLASCAQQNNLLLCAVGPGFLLLTGPAHTTPCYLVKELPLNSH